MSPRHRYCLGIITATLILTGCANSPMKLKEDNILDKIAGSPYIEPLTEKIYQAMREADAIQIYYRQWNPLTAPTAYKGWQSVFQISTGSDPGREYEQIAQLTHYLRLKDDQQALGIMREIAADHGGDAMVDVYRSPAINNTSLPADIIGYRYHATIVRLGEPITAANE